MKIRPLLPITFLFLFFFACEQQKNQPTEKKITDKLTQKYEPSEEFFLQRSYPDGKFNVRAYTTALKDAKQASIANTRDINGFDEAWTTQGPGNIGARANCVVANPQNEDVIYTGFAKGGVFKTTDGGTNWNPIFDDQTFLSIGDIVLDPNDPETIYVGTGDVNISGYPSIGDGLHRSTDGGNTWEHLGLEEQRIISKIVVDPTNSERIFVGAMGLPFERNDERGLYRSEDNGATWEQVLFLSDSTGVIDVLMNPDNPDVLYAAGWDRIRNNIESVVEGFGAKIYKSIDGGDSWNLMEGGLPNDIPHSRIGMEMYGSDPDILFIHYVGSDLSFESIYKSIDAGESWFQIPSDEYANGLPADVLRTFGWYFGKIRVNPNNENDIFILGVDLWRTLDGGNSWFMATPIWWQYSVHADKHDLLFLPSGDIILTTDGGLYRTDNSAQEWVDIENIPTTQFYRVAYNPHNPNLYFGGAQDNGSTGGSAAGINDWLRIYGGDGFQMAFDTENPNRFFAETQNGNIVVTLDGGYFFDDGTFGIDFDDRRNWDMPYFISPHDNNVLYTGTYRVYKGEGQIPFWNTISDDLSDGTDEEHRYHNITTINESPLVEGLLYVGTGDGNVWRKDSNNPNWISISNGLPDQYVTDVYASPTDENVVYVTYSGYRDNDNMPRIHRSEDKGATWTDISSDLPDLAINKLLVLPDFSDSILFVATDGGIYGSIDKAESWERVGTNMPMAINFDMVINEANNQLVAGTFARSIMTYPLDSLIASYNFVEDSIDVSQSEPTFAIKHSLKVYPSPASDFVQIELGNIEQGRSFEVAILNSIGQLQYHQKGDGQTGEYQVDVSQWPAGTYFVKTKIRHQVVVEQFVKN
ncbi:MAG: T9SS type A sorting domain-containing protein [Saprospiraceae bacterium]